MGLGVWGSGFGIQAGSCWVFLMRAGWSCYFDLPTQTPKIRTPVESYDNERGLILGFEASARYRSPRNSDLKNAWIGTDNLHGSERIILTKSSIEIHSSMVPHTFGCREVSKRTCCHKGQASSVSRGRILNHALLTETINPKPYNPKIRNPYTLNPKRITTQNPQILKPLYPKPLNPAPYNP